MRTLALNVLALVFTFASFIDLEAQQWRRFSGPPGGTFDAIAVSSVDPQIVVTIVHGEKEPYYSSNGGATWQQFRPLPNDWWGYRSSALTIVTGTAQTVRMLFDEFVVETSDFGATWIKRSEIPNSNVLCLLTHPIDANYWFAWGNSPPVMRSTNAGKDWDTVFVSKALGLSNVIVSPAAPARMYLEVKDTLFESIDTGRTWKQVPYTGLGTSSIDLLAADIAIADRLYGYFQGRIGVSTDKGRTWSDKTGRNVLTVDGISQEASNSATLYAWGTDVHISTDQGNTWTTVDTMHVDRKDAVLHQKQLYVSCYESGIFKGSIGGTTWTRLDRGFNRLALRNLIVVNDRTWYTQGINDVMTTTDGGDTWMILTPVKYDQPSGGRVYSFDVSRTNQKNMVGGTNSDIYHSTDGGMTWLGATPAQNEPIESISIHPSNSSEVVCGGLYNLKRSTDGGITWKNDLANNHFRVLAIGRSPIAPSHMIAAEEQDVYSTIDGGVTWTKHEEVVYEPYQITGDAVVPSTFYATGYGLATTTDNGATWKNLWPEASSVRTMVQDPRNADVIWATEESGRGILLRITRSTGKVDTVNDPGYETEAFRPNAIAIVGDKIIAATEEGMVWFDPTLVGVREYNVANVEFQADEMVRRSVVDLQGMVVYGDIVRGDQAQYGHQEMVKLLPSGMYYLRMSAGDRVKGRALLNVR